MKPYPITEEDVRPLRTKLNGIFLSDGAHDRGAHWVPEHTGWQTDNSRINFRQGLMEAIGEEAGVWNPPPHQTTTKTHAQAEILDATVGFPPGSTVRLAILTTAWMSIQEKINAPVESAVKYTHWETHQQS
jgi:hypothetical protein